MCFARVETRDVDGDEARIARKGGPRPRREVLKPRADRKDDVSLAAMALAEFEPVTPIGPTVQRLSVNEIGASGDGFDDGKAVGAGEGRELCRRLGILHAAPGNDRRDVWRSPNRSIRGVSNVAGIGRRAPNAVHALLEEFFRDSRKPNPARPGAGRGRPGRNRRDRASWRSLRQGLEDLRGMRDPVPESRHRLEGVVDADASDRQNARPAAAQGRAGVVT